jgi:hypothetical protein
MPVPDLCREYGMSSATFYKWRAKYGGMDASMMSRLKELESPLSQDSCRCNSLTSFSLSANSALTPLTAPSTWKANVALARKSFSQAKTLLDVTLYLEHVGPTVLSPPSKSKMTLILNAVLYFYCVVLMSHLLNETF